MIGIKPGTNIRRIGLTGLLSASLLLSLAACGDATPASQPTSTVISEAIASETIPAEVGTEVAEVPQDLTTPAPQVIATGTTEMSGMPGMDASPTAASESQGEVVEIQATLREWALDLSQTEVPAGTVRFVVTNAGQFAHNLTVTDDSGNLAQTPTFGSAEGPQVVEVELAPGTYEIICSLPGHANRGQRAQLVVK